MAISGSRNGRMWDCDTCFISLQTVLSCQAWIYVLHVSSCHFHWLNVLCWHFIHISLTVLMINNNKNNIRTITFIDDLYCVGWGVKLYSLTRAVIYGRHVRVHMGHLRWSVPGTSLPLIGQAANLSVESAVVFLLSHKSDSHFTIPQWASVDCWGCFFLKNFGKFWITDWQNESLNVNDKQILLCTNLLNGIYL